MANEPCSPEEIERLATLIADGKFGKVKIEDVDIEEAPNMPKSPHDPLVKSGQGWFGHTRTMRGMMGDVFSARGHNDVSMAYTRSTNIAGEYIAKLNKAMAPLQEGSGAFFGSLKNKFFGPPVELDRELGIALESIGKGGTWIHDKRRFSDPVQRAAPQVRLVLDEMAEKFGIDPDKYIQGYLPHMRQKEPGHGIFYNNAKPTILEDRFVKMLTPEETKWFHELERHDGLQDYEKRASVALSAYLRGAVRAKVLKPVLKDVEQRVINPMFNTRFIRTTDGRVKILVNDKVGYNAWNEYTHYLLGGPTAGDVRNTRILQQITRNYGYDTNVQGLYSLSNAISNMFYAGVLGSPIGGRPASVIRQLFQLVPTYAELGAINSIKGIKRAMDDIPHGIELKRLTDMGLLTSHVDNLVTSMEVSKGLGRAIAAGTDASMKMFSAVDRFTRIATALGAEENFNKALTSGNLASLKARKEIKDEVVRRAANGRIEDAKALYMADTVANLQYIYGKANRPEVLRGALGNLTGMLMAYPMNTFEMVRMFGKRAVQDGDPMPLIRLMGVTTAAMFAGSEMLDADLSSAMWYSAAPHSLFFPKLAIDTFQAGNSTVDWLTGSLFNTGMTSYETQKMWEHYNEAARGMTSFFPGLGAATDVMKAVDEGSLARMLALTPKAAKRDELAKERQRLERQETMPQGAGLGGGLSGLGTIRGF